MAVIYRNSRAYLYKSVRQGGRVTSEYQGSGQAAFLIGELERAERQEADEQRQSEREERDRLDDLDRALDGLAERSRALAHEALTAAGYHQHHRGEWRRSREHRNCSTGTVRACDEPLGGIGSDRPSGGEERGREYQEKSEP